MRAETVFLAGYCVLLLALAAGLHRLGRINTDVWASRVLAGHRRAAGDRPPSDPPGPVTSHWPHSEVPRLHTGMALVATSAAALLSGAELLGHHQPGETALLGGVLAVSLVAGIRLAACLREGG